MAVVKAAGRSGLYIYTGFWTHIEEVCRKFSFVRMPAACTALQSCAKYGIVDHMKIIILTGA